MVMLLRFKGQGDTGLFLTFFLSHGAGGGMGDGWGPEGQGNSNCAPSVWVHPQLFAKLGASLEGLENDARFWFCEFTYCLF